MTPFSKSSCFIGFSTDFTLSPDISFFSFSVSILSTFFTICVNDFDCILDCDSLEFVFCSLLQKKNEIKIKIVCYTL